MSLVELIAQAGGRALAAAGLACLDRCVPLLGGDDEILRPLWASLAEPGESGAAGEPGVAGVASRDWGACVEQVRAKLYVAVAAEDDTSARGDLSAGRVPAGGDLPAGGDVPAEGDVSAEGGAVALAHRMLGTAPVEPTAASLGEWADACSVAALRIHRLLDGPAGAAAADASWVAARREGRTEDMSPLAAAELRRQIAVLELLAAHGPAGLRRARDLTTEGRRVLRAVVSRRARGRV